jgi:general stress protein 26
MTAAELFTFIDSQTFAVEASVSPSGAPQAAAIGFVVTERFEIFFDTIESTRKARNLRRNSRVAFVIGGMDGGERTVQYEGVADEPEGADLERLTERYFRRFPDGPGRRAWPGLIYLRATPTWIRYSDFSVNPPRVEEFDAAQLCI